MPDLVDTLPMDLGNLSTVQLATSKYKGFIAQLSKAAGDTFSLSELPQQDRSANVYVIPAPLEQAARVRNGWGDDAQWLAMLRKWGATAVNVLSTEAVFRLIELGRNKAALTGSALPAPPLLGPVPAESTGPMRAPLPTQFQGPFDWQLECCRIPQAWSLFAATERHRHALPWQDIRVGHIDTGYTEHAALGWFKGASTTVLTEAGFDFFSNKKDARDPFLPQGNPGHGTRTSATIAGFYPTAPISPYYGAAPGAKIVPYRVTDAVNVDHVKRHVTAAIRDAVAKKCDVISISLGALFGDKALAAALDHAYDNGVIVVCAAGNIWGEVIYPGRYNRCITMGGIGPRERPWAGSANGQYVDLCGPAQQVRRVKPENIPRGQTAAGLYAPPDGSGTSYATALCAGIAALWLAWHGRQALEARYPEAWQRASAFKRLLRKSARSPAQWDPSRYGSGILNAHALLKEELPAPTGWRPAFPANGQFDPED